MGICLGHQLMALATGAKTAKLKYGHRGPNHPVKDLKTNKVHITSQNHGYYVKSCGYTVISQFLFFSSLTMFSLHPKFKSDIFISPSP